MPNETPNFNSISILNKLYSADVVDNEFTTDDGQKRTYSSLELEIQINGQKRKLAITLPRVQTSLSCFWSPKTNHQTYLTIKVKKICDKVDFT